MFLLLVRRGSNMRVLPLSIFYLAPKKWPRLRQSVILESLCGIDTLSGSP